MDKGGSWEDPSCTIKMNKKIVGSITVKKRWTNAPYIVMFMIVKSDINEDGNPNCEWKWITLKKEYATIQDAKQRLNENIDKITRSFNLYQMED